MSDKWPIKPKGKKINWRLVLAIILISIPCYLVIGILSFGHNVEKRQQMAIKAVKTLDLPSDWEYRNENPYGDAIDSSYNVGIQYNYRSNGRADALAPKIQEVLKQHGFTITQYDGLKKSEDGKETWAVIESKRSSDDIIMRFDIEDNGSYSQISVDSNAVRPTNEGNNE